MSMKAQKALSIGLVALALLMSALASLFELYNVFEWYDEALHAYFLSPCRSCSRSTPTAWC